MSNPENGTNGNHSISKMTLYDKCKELAGNLWWSWHPDAVNLFRDLDLKLWRSTDHNPIALLRQFTPATLEQRAYERVLTSKINYCYRQMRQYLAKRPQWAEKNVGALGSRPVAYFSLEFGIHESVPIYSGGLGILAGDHIKSVSDLGIPLVAVGLFYDQGYFKQQLNADGVQEEVYGKTNIADLPMEAVMIDEKTQLVVPIETENDTIFARAWHIKVGRVDLYLLDCDMPENKEQDRTLTSRLYGGDSRTRIRQEMIIGIGGVKLLHALGIRPGVYHLNEGHCAFATLQAVANKMADDGFSFHDAMLEVAYKTCFTTHTPVPAGHDRFEPGLMHEHLSPLQRKLGIDFGQLMALGRVNPQDDKEYFCMTVLGLKLSKHANAVSCLHGNVSRRMWSCLYPDRSETKVPIGHITNGVHVPTWLAWQMQNLYDRNFQPNWLDEHGHQEVWQKIYEVDPGELWETHITLKHLMLDFVQRRITRQAERRGEKPCCDMDPTMLTIGFARRFATYKRATLLLRDVQRLDRLVNNPDCPVQFIFAGKAHPADQPGKEFIRQIANLRNDPRFAGKFVFVEDYDINVARHIVQGVDVWMNNPRRPLEASGTSGQKAVLNGVLNFSVLDGWWAEAYNGSNGFSIGTGTSHVNEAITDTRDGDSLFDILEHKIVPTYYATDPHGLPMQWIEMMKNSIGTLAWRFSAHRMVMDYMLTEYLPAAGGVTCDMNYRQ